MGKSKYLIDITNQQTLLPIHSQKVKSLARAVFVLEKVVASQPIELGIAFVNDRKIRFLNSKFHHQNKATDVLAFPMDISMPKEGPWMMGEVVVSVERALVHSKRFKMDFKKEVALYIVHGILHLLGYKDDQDHRAKKMWERQNYILEKAYRGI